MLSKLSKLIAVLALKKKHLLQEFHLFISQYELQIVLIILALVSALWMLLAKPCFLHRRYKRKLKQQAKVESQKLVSQPNFDNLDVDPENQLGQESSTDMDTPVSLQCELDADPGAYQFESDTDAIIPESGDVEAGTATPSDESKKKKKKKESSKNGQMLNNVQTTEMQSPDEEKVFMAG